MANHALPTTSSLYTDVLTNLKDRIDDSLKMLDSVNTSPTNVPTNAVRWNSTTKLWEKYSGSAWGSLAESYAIQVLKSSNLVGGNSTTLLGSIPYQSNTDTTTLLAPNTTTTRKFLRQTGTGTNGAAPVWDTLLAADIPVLDTSKITTGTLPVSRGGTGVTTSTGTGSVVLSASPTFTGTVTAPTFSGALTGNATTATTANALNSSNSYTGAVFTANAGVFRTQNWGGVPTNGVVYYGSANSYIYKGGANWEFKNEQSGFTNNLNTSGTIVTQDGGTWSINATSSSALVGDETNWASYRSRSVANMLGWKNYGNGHCIFDASASTAPNGVAVNNTNSNTPWSPTYPTLMGWNGSNTFGVRVDSARVADYVTNGTGLGIEQTWQDVTASRACGTTYTNSTGKPIMVSATWANTATVGSFGSFTVGAISSIGYSGTYAAGANVGNGTCIVVPNGATYTLTLASANLLKWHELR